MTACHYYAQINAARTVTAITQTAAPVDSAELIALPGYDTHLLGHTHNAATGLFEAPPPAVVPPPPRRITPLAFRRRFTKPERATIEWAAVDRAELPPEQRMQAAALRADLKDQAQATFIDLDDADVASGVQALEAAGLIGAARALQILDTPIRSEETHAG